MTAPQTVACTLRLAAAKAEGLALRVDAGELKVSGPREARMSFLSGLRTHKAEILTLLSRPAARRWLLRHPSSEVASHSFTSPATLAEVLDWYPGAEVEPAEEVLAETAPPLSPTRVAAVIAWLDAVTEDDPDTWTEYLAAVGADSDPWPAYLPSPNPPAPVAPHREAERSEEESARTRGSRSACPHRIPDPVNPPGGLGICKVEASASRQPGSLWPTGEIVCREWHPINPIETSETG